MSKKSSMINFFKRELNYKTSEVLKKSEDSHYGLDVYCVHNKTFAIGTDEQAQKAYEKYIIDNIWIVPTHILYNMTKLSIFKNDDIMSESNIKVIQLLVKSTCGFKSFLRQVLLHSDRGQHLGFYDGNEYEQDNYYIYRIN